MFTEPKDPHFFFTIGSLSSWHEHHLCHDHFCQPPVVHHLPHMVKTGECVCVSVYVCVWFLGASTHPIGSQHDEWPNVQKNCSQLRATSSATHNCRNTRIASHDAMSASWMWKNAQVMRKVLEVCEKFSSFWVRKAGTDGQKNWTWWKISQDERTEMLKLMEKCSRRTKQILQSTEKILKLNKMKINKKTFELNG